MKKLVIVESPTKAKTLNKILPKEFIIEASKGHVRDLPKKGLAIDVDHNFEPEYEVPEKSKKVVSALKKHLKEVDGVILATDPDREGEAIAWHLKHILTSVKKYKDLPFERVVFHELTKNAVLDAFSHPGELNTNLVDSQQARRVLDRLVGYKLSPLLWKKVRFGLSAGRVQSVAVRLIVEKERERDAFVPDEYWKINVDLYSTDDKTKEVTALLDKKNDKKFEVKDEKTAKEVESDLQKAKYTVDEIKKSKRSKKPNAPFKTSTLQQNMANSFGFNANRTMKGAQKLFELGLITYHRTDSISLSPEFVSAARKFATKKFGKNYVPKDAIEYKSKSKNAQEAHEGIRPTDIELLPEGLKKSVPEDAKKVYTMIWKRSVESQMESAVYDQTSLKIKTDNGYGLKASGSIITFDGWLAVDKLLNISADSENLNVLPEFNEGEALSLNKVEPTQHFTQPPARYSDASLIKKLEELGIGRPSTYAPTLMTIMRRGYVEKEGRYFKPKDVAYVVSDLLVEHFPTVTDYDFTADMEEKFDTIAHGKTKWVPVIKDFYKPFEKRLEEKDKTLNKHDVTNLGETDEKCPECGNNLVIKLGKYGKFLSCSNYPECEFAKPIHEDLPLDENGNEITEFGKCDQCEDGKFILKTGRFGKFLACSNYPKCKNSKPYLEKIGMTCPTCGEGDVIVKKAKGRTFYGCSNYPDCKYSSWKNPMQNKEDSEDNDSDDGDE